VRFTVTCLAVAGALVVFTAASARAHHSFAAAFDATKPVVVTGVITEVRLVNPHSQFVLDVTDTTGKVETWRFEGSTPSSLIRSGFKPGTLKVGDKVTVKGSHARDMTQNAGAAREIVTADGRSFIVGPAGEEGSGGY
jgi:DNA/RNA endonuclease YhcR with UshA esterase domain